MIPASLPLFPLQTVLFPGGVLPLRIFEPRYMDMAGECLRTKAPFGICLISEGEEVGAPAVPHLIGTTARILSWDMPQTGILQVTVRGERRFRILGCEAGKNGLIRGQVEMLPESVIEALPEVAAALVPLLKLIAADLGLERLPEPHCFDDAEWVGMRFSEVLPVSNLARQKLLELDKPRDRLEVIWRFLEQKGLLGGRET